MPNLNSLALIVSEISAFIRTSGRTDGQTDMARSTRLVILIKNIYFMVRKRVLLPVTYFPTNLVYPFTLRVMARSTRLVILIKNIYTLWGRKRFLPTNSDDFYSTSNGYKNEKVKKPLYPKDTLFFSQHFQPTSEKRFLRGCRWNIYKQHLSYLPPDIRNYLCYLLYYDILSFYYL